MYWRQKASLLCTTQQRSNALLNNVATFLAGKDIRYQTVIQAPADTRAVIIQVGYNVKADADQIWSQVQTANTNNWITSGFAGYAQVPETEAEGQYILLDRIDW